MTWFVAVCLLGSGITWMLKGDGRFIQWAKTSSEAMKYPAPNINSATAQELERLPGIGLKTAEKIVAHRNINGPFMSVYDLRYVKGITRKSLNKILEFYENPPAGP